MTFREYLTEENNMNPSPEKTGAEKMDYFDALGDEMGMDWQDIVTAIEGEPWVSAQFTLGNELNYKRSAWKIVKGSLNRNGADIVLKPERGDRSYLKGNRLNKGVPDEQRYHLDRKQLIAFLTGGWTPPPGGAAGGMGGMPGMI